MNKDRAWMRRRRRQLGMTQAELAQKAGMAQRTVAAYEAGERTPRVPAAMRLGDALDEDWRKFYEEEKP